MCGGVVEIGRLEEATSDANAIAEGPPQNLWRAGPVFQDWRRLWITIDWETS
jgi:hypothetical protein